MSDYYNNSGTPGTRSALSSSAVRTEFAAISTGFNKLAPLTGNGNRLVKVNAGGTAQEVALMLADTGTGILIGPQTPRSVGGASRTFQIETAAAEASASIMRNSADTLGGVLVLGKSRGTLIGTSNIVQSGDEIGSLIFAGADGTDANTPAAAIQAFADGTPGANDMPGRLVFSTTADGSATLTERLSIDSAGLATFAGAVTVTGILTAPTAAVDTNTTQAATTAYVLGQGYLKSATAATTYAPLASPTFTGVPAAPTAGAGTNTTQLATTAFVNTAVTGGGLAGSFTTLATQAGSALLPSIIPASDANTGRWYPAADTIAESTGGVERMRIDTIVRFAAQPTLASGDAIYKPLQDRLISPSVGDGASIVSLEGGGMVQDLVERFSVPVIGVGDGVADDTAVIVAALARVASGGVAMCRPGKTYRITSGIVIANNYQVLDLNGSTLLADFASGTAVTVGNGVSTVSALGIRNGVIKTTNPSTSLNGVIFEKNVRRRVEYGGLWISGFKGVGLQFEELNWSIQEKDAPLIENCGVNLDINDNGNAITISGIGLDGATSYNARLRGTVAVTFVGGYIQNAGTAGIMLDTGTLGALQQSLSTSLFGVYLEANGTSHIIGTGGKGLTVKGCFINCNTMSGQAIDLNSWTGADITGNTVQNTGGRDFVNADAASTLIRIGRQNVTTMTDVVIGGSADAYVADGFPAPVATLPAASLVNRGTTLLLAETGTAANSSRPYMSMDLASGSRGFRQIELRPRKQGATAGGATLTPDFGAIEIYDLTLLSAGITVNAPVGPFKDGDEITFIFKQSAAPTGAVVWNAVYKTDLSATLLAAAYGSVVFRYSGGRLLWVQVSKMEWKV